MSHGKLMTSGSRVVPVFDSTDPAGWAAAFDRADLDLLDCVAVNAALLLLQAGVPDVRTPFAAEWRFDLVCSARNTVPLVDLPSSRMDERLLRHTGHWLEWQTGGDYDDLLEAWGECCASGESVLVVADAYVLPWSPYAGHMHMEHSFLVTALESGAARVVDGYRNTTQWGPSTPVLDLIPLTDLAPALPTCTRWAVLRVTGQPEATSGPAPTPPAALVRESVAAVRAATEHGHYQRFLDAWAGAATSSDLSQLAVQTWLLARDRGLHALWLSNQAAAAVPAAITQRFTSEVAQAWSRVQELTYIALRRVDAGRAVPGALAERLRLACAAEPLLAEDLATC